MPTITPGAASTAIPETVDANYDRYKYMFHGWINSQALADALFCTGIGDLLVKPYHVQSAVIMSEDAAWIKPLDDEYLQCLPKEGVKVLGHVRFESGHTTDFTPIFNNIEAQHPNLIVTGISHVGVQPTVMARSAGADPDGRAKFSGYDKHVLGCLQRWP